MSHFYVKKNKALSPNHKDYIIYVIRGTEHAVKGRACKDSTSLENFSSVKIIFSIFALLACSITPSISYPLSAKR